MVGVGTSPLEDTIFVVGNQGAVMTFKFDPAHRRLVQFFPELSIRNVAFSADGKWMLVCQERYRESVLFRARSDGGEWQPLTDRKLWVHQGQFSRDGTRIALMGKWPDRPWKIYWVAAEGGALHELNAPIVSQADPNWMPDGERILFGQPPQYFAETGEPRAIYLHDLQTNSTSKVPGSEGWFSPRIAPDGRSFLALSIDEHKLGLYDFVNSRWRVLVENEQDRVQVPSWSPDGGWAYVNIYGNSHYLLRIRVRDGAAEKVVSYREMFASPYCWTWNSAPDGSLLVSCLHLNADIYALRYE